MAVRPNMLTVEFLLEYPGGVEKIQEDATGKDPAKLMKAVNFILAAVVRSCYRDDISRAEAIRLVSINDYADTIQAALTALQELEILKKNRGPHPALK